MWKWPQSIGHLQQWSVSYFDSPLFFPCGFSASCWLSALANVSFSVTLLKKLSFFCGLHPRFQAEILSCIVPWFSGELLFAFHRNLHAALPAASSRSPLVSYAFLKVSVSTVWPRQIFYKPLFFSSPSQLPGFPSGLAAWLKLGFFWSSFNLNKNRQAMKPHFYKDFSSCSCDEGALLLLCGDSLRVREPRHPRGTPNAGYKTWVALDSCGLCVPCIPYQIDRQISPECRFQGIILIC